MSKYYYDRVDDASMEYPMHRSSGQAFINELIFFLILSYIIIYHIYSNGELGTPQGCMAFILEHINLLSHPDTWPVYEENVSSASHNLIVDK